MWETVVPLMTVKSGAQSDLSAAENKARAVRAACARRVCRGFHAFSDGTSLGALATHQSFDATVTEDAPGGELWLERLLTHRTLPFRHQAARST